MKFYRAACIAAIAASLCGPSALASERIAFTAVDGLIQVHASLAGGPPVPLLVDLGAGLDIVSAETARSLNLPADSIALGGFVVDHPTVGVWKGLDGSGFAGLISATAFRDVAVAFDFVSHEIIVEDPASLKRSCATGFKIGVTPTVKPNDPKNRAEAVVPFVRLAGAPATQRTAPTAIFADLIRLQRRQRILGGTAFYARYSGPFALRLTPDVRP